MEIKNYKEWEIDGLIGEGTFGKVYKISRQRSGHTYYAALKVIEVPQEQSRIDTLRNDGMSEQNIKEYLQNMVNDISEEFELMSKLKGHSNIVNCEDFCVEEKEDGLGWNIYIQMELLTPLFEYIGQKQNKMTANGLIQIGIDICKALEICQKYSIIHYDIKPENILVSDIGEYKLGDFGIAKKLEKASLKILKKGTPSYMAPEIYKGTGCNPTIDIYSLGIVLYRFFNDNRLPFMPPIPQPVSSEDKKNANSMRINNCNMPKPCNASNEVAKIILKACSYNPGERYASAEIMRGELEKVLSSGIENKVINIPEDNKTEDSINPTIDIFKGNVQESDTVDDSSSGDTDIEPGSEDTEDIYYREGNKGKFIQYWKYIVFGIVGIVAGIIVFLLLKESSIKVPNLNRMPVEKAEEILKKDKMVLKIVKEEYSDIISNGQIISQKLDEGEKVRKDTVIEVVVSKGKEPKEEIQVIVVPGFKNLSQDEAKQKASEYKLSVDITKKFSDTVKQGNIISQDPPKGTEIEPGSCIRLVVSKGQELVVVPKTRGIKLEKAKKLLKSKKLKYKVKSEFNNHFSSGTVIRQDIQKGRKVKKGTVIILTVSKGAKPVPTKTPQSSTYNGGSGSSGSSSGSSSGVSKSSDKIPVVTKKPVTEEKPKTKKDNSAVMNLFN